MKKNNLPAACGLALTLLLVACGGGGGGDSTSTLEPTPTPTPIPTPTPPVEMSTTALQGLWQSTRVNETVAAVVLPDGRLWQVTTDTSTAPATTVMVKAKLEVQGTSFSGTGRRYTFGAAGSTPASATVSANVVEKTNLSGFVNSGGANVAYNLAYLTRYDTAAVLSDYAGSWTATLGSGVVNWTISTTGALSGTRTTGCTYSGQLGLRAENKAVVDAAVAESCAGSVTSLSGVGVLNADKSRISLFMTSADEASAVVISLGH